MIDINKLIDQQELEEDRDYRKYGSDEFEYIEDARPTKLKERSEW